MEKHENYLRSSEEKAGGENEDYWLKIISLDLEEAEERYKAYVMHTAEALETTSLDQVRASFIGSDIYIFSRS